MNVLAVIPAYNEEESLASTVNELIETCPQVDYLVIDDGSSDKTWDICKQQGFSHIHMPVNTGLSSVFRTGMKYALRHDYDAVVQLDADGQHVPEYIPTMARAMEEQNADIVIASRVLNGEAPSGLRNAGSKLLSWLIKRTTGATITDPTSGMRLYNRKMIEMFATGFDVHPEPDMVALVARRGGRIAEIPAHVRERQGGESYLTIGRSVSYMLRTSLSILLYQWLR
ncbi:MAG: glycosyltransferase family 2 protein [Atopobiaceae bacterium]|nr:glycosyltransferase family 2 protein [Atopobiaceae bacterium]